MGTTQHLVISANFMYIHVITCHRQELLVIRTCIYMILYVYSSIGRIIDCIDDSPWICLNCSFSTTMLDYPLVSDGLPAYGAQCCTVRRHYVLTGGTCLLKWSRTGREELQCPHWNRLYEAQKKSRITHQLYHQHVEKLHHPLSNLS